MEKDNKEDRTETAMEEDFEALLDQSMADPVHLFARDRRWRR